MSQILLINTALEIAQVGIIHHGKLLAQRTQERQNDQAAWLHPAIQELLNESNLTIDQLCAVGICSGPGSYTGLRVGMAAAKGICYARNIPLISVSTLRMLAAAIQKEVPGLIISLIDARREEVFAGVYDNDLNTLQHEQALVLRPDVFEKWRSAHPIALTGSGAMKALKFLNAKDFFVAETKDGFTTLAGMIHEKWLRSDFADLAYLEPDYLKEFYTPAKDG